MTGRNYAVIFEIGNGDYAGRRDSVQLPTLGPNPPIGSGNQKLKVSQEI